MKLFQLLVLCRAGGNFFPCQMYLQQLKGDLFLCDSALCFVLEERPWLFGRVHVNTEPRGNVAIHQLLVLHQDPKASGDSNTFLMRIC